MYRTSLPTGIKLKGSQEKRVFGFRLFVTRLPKPSIASDLDKERWEAFPLMIEHAGHRYSHQIEVIHRFRTDCLKEFPHRGYVPIANSITSCGFDWTRGG